MSGPRAHLPCGLLAGSPHRSDTVDAVSKQVFASGIQNGSTLHQVAQIVGSSDFLPNFLPKEAAQRSLDVIYLVTVANWRSRPECGTSLPSWSCGLDSRRPLLSASYLVIPIFWAGSAAARHSSARQRQAGLAWKARCACGTLVPARVPCSRAHWSRCGCACTGPQAGPGPVRVTCGCCWWPTW